MYYENPRDTTKEAYQVFLMSSPASLPLSFARHPWFVVNKKGELSRWGLHWNPHVYPVKDAWGHLATDALLPFQGLRIFYIKGSPYWGSTVHKVIEGDEGSLAARMADVITNSPQTYPYTQEYSFFGPNSNTYAQWVLNQFPESGMKLPWNAFGKNYLS